MLDELFTASAATETSLDLDYERALILSAQTVDKQAAWTLVWQYRGLLQATFYRVTRAVKRMTAEQREDLQQDLLATTLEVIQNFDFSKHERLSHVLPGQLKNTALEVSTALAIPRGTLALWFKIWRAGGKDFDVAAALAPAHGMSSLTFRSITGALEFAGSEWVTLPFNADNVVPDTETYRLAHLAMEALTPAEHIVIEHAYGFRGDPKSDGEVADLLGHARSTVSTLRTRGLDRMRRTLTSQKAVLRP